MSFHTNKRAILTYGVWLLLLCGVAGCAVEEACLCMQRLRGRQATACDPCYGYHPTVWYTSPFCPCQPPLARLPVVKGDLGDGVYEVKPIDPPPDWETVPTPRAESDETRKPAAPEPPQTKKQLDKRAVK